MIILFIIRSHICVVAVNYKKIKIFEMTLEIKKSKVFSQRKLKSVCKNFKHKT